MNRNIYLAQIYHTLPRLLSLFDGDSTSESWGMGDRYHWAWGLIDFGNGTFQGAANGLAQLWKNGQWPYDTKRERFIERINAMFSATAKLTRHDGSLEEAFPREGSFCVTGLVAFDLLCACDLLKGDIPGEMLEKWMGTVAPLISFLLESDESHGIISNHLATAAVALARWQWMTGCAKSEKKARELLARVCEHQSSEGWFREYEGADPGYQTLCTYYLAEAHILRPDWNLLDPLKKSIRFLSHFAHPDGSFGGIYGSRNTRFYCPAGFEILAPLIPEAAVLATYMIRNIADMRVVSLMSMDEPNLIPMFNAYCRSAALFDNLPKWTCPECALPAFTLRGSIQFPEAGIVVDGGERHYSIISTHKGGVVLHFRNGKRVVHDGGVVVRRADGIMGSTQGYCPDNKVVIHDREVSVQAVISRMPKRLPRPWQFLVLRLLCLTLFRMQPVRERVKRLMVRMLITDRKKWPVKNRRLIRLGEHLSVVDRLDVHSEYEKADAGAAFISVHMASQGYWQIQDEENLR